MLDPDPIRIDDAFDAILFDRGEALPDLAELYVVKEGAGDAGEIALLEKSTTKGRRASLPALARQSSGFDEAAAWLVREWAESDVETATAVTSSARCEVYAAPSGTTCDAGGSLPGLPGAVP